MISTETETELMKEIQRNLRKEDDILIRHIVKGDLTKDERYLVEELQDNIRKIDKTFNYIINNYAFTKKDIIKNVVGKKNSYENHVPESITPVQVNKSELTSIFSEGNNLEALISKLLLRIGIPAKIKGFSYIRTGLILLVENKVEKFYITKNLYPEVANIYKTTSSSVERCIRHAIEVAWNRGDLEILNEIFSYSISEKKGKTTNGEFLYSIADFIRFNFLSR